MAETIVEDVVRRPPMRPSTRPRYANEVLSILYGTNVSARRMIEAFRPIQLRFKSRSAAILLDNQGHMLRFDLPVNCGPESWHPPRDLSPEEVEALHETYEEVASLLPHHGQSIVDIVFRRQEKALWMLWFVCKMPRPTMAEASKRATGDIRIVLNNDGHSHGCIYRHLLTEQLVWRAAVEDHDLIAVYAGYFDQMLRDLSFVPMQLIQAEWSKALVGSALANTGYARHRAGLPWGEQAPSATPTITLSLDLRKSTFAMQQTRDRKEYARWLEALAELAREIVLHNGGIFDKFTGDGVISHFVYPDGDVPNDAAAEAQAIEAAMVCAAELMRAVNIHIGNVLAQLKFKSRAFGAAIGMAKDMAAWSLDRDGKPVVVGQGIVNACRLNSGRAGDYLITNDLKYRLEQGGYGLRFEEYELGATHKDFAPQLEATCWKIVGGEGRLGRSEREMRMVVDKVWADVRRAD